MRYCRRSQVHEIGVAGVAGEHLVKAARKKRIEGAQRVAVRVIGARGGIDLKLNPRRPTAENREVKSDKLAGKTFVFTGTFANRTQEEAEAIKRLGSGTAEKCAGR
ncbi:MAG: hypothetical protein AUH13_25355 [Acidobacteria bacterium 13_2_20CM_58_27]|nr:MAG: hypothetical protein AUH13_25355 [Acidobacteria bacterium 13_2_20CM_58_27]